MNIPILNNVYMHVDRKSARFGDEVDAPPPFPHRIEHGAVVRSDPGVPIPTTDDDAATGDSSDIRSIPRM